MLKRTLQRQSVQRLGVSLCTLLVLLLTVYCTKGVQAQTTEAVIFIPPVSEQLVHASVVNGSSDALTVRVTHQGDTEDLVPLQPIGPGETIFFAVLSGQCQFRLVVWVNGRRYRHLGHLCPESYPDERKTIYLVSMKGRVIAEVLGEDVD